MNSPPDPLEDDYVPPDVPPGGHNDEERTELERLRRAGLSVVPHQQDKSADDQPDRFPRLNWREAFATDFSAINWLSGRFMEAGQQVSCVGDGKVGKSLFAVNWIWCAISGRSFLGDERRDPIKVLYFDRENSLRDIITRLQGFGATEKDFDLLDKRFDYRMFPRFSGQLDSSAAAAFELMEIVAESKPDVVVLDTVSRFISGNENDSSTWLDFYGRVHSPLKAQGIAALRLDHTGKDRERGSRGSSAKSQDVDHVWELSSLGSNTWPDRSNNTELITTNLKMHRTYTRTGIGDDTLLITRRSRRVKGGLWIPGTTAHQLTTEQPAEEAPEGSVDWIVARLNKTDLPKDAGRDAVKAKCAELGLPTTTKKLVDVVKARKLSSDLSYSPVTQPVLDPRTGEDRHA